MHIPHNKNKHKIQKSHSHKNSIELIHNKTEKYIPHNSTLASFNITNLYTNIPTSENLQILANMLKQNSTPQVHIDEIIKITTIITQQNYFHFNKKYYTQPEGLPLGSPISSILAEIFIHYIEQIHILNEQNNKIANKILYWYR